MTVRNIAQAINDALDLALAKDSDVVLMGEDVGRTGGVFRVTDGLRERHGPERVIDAPVAESGIVGVGLGMAVGGLKPVLELQFMGFSYPAYDQVVNHVARIRNRSRHRFSAPLVIRIPYGGGIGAAEHHSESMEAIYSHVPGLKVAVPATPYDAKAMLLAAIEDPDPVIFLEPIRLYRAVREEVPEGWLTQPLGEARVEREGDDVSLITWGAMTKETREAAALLENQGISAEIIDLRSLVPLDLKTLTDSVQRTGRAVIVHEAPRTGGFGAEVAALLQEHCLFDLAAPVRRVTGWDTVFPLKRSERHYLPTATRIAAVAAQLLEV